jgi:hypothetical protein
MPEHPVRGSTASGGRQLMATSEAVYPYPQAERRPLRVYLYGAGEFPGRDQGRRRGLDRTAPSVTLMPSTELRVRASTYVSLLIPRIFSGKIPAIIRLEV